MARKTAIALVVYQHEKGAELLVIQPTNHPHRWMLPQGGVKRGEKLVAAALREVREETGVALQNKKGRKQGRLEILRPRIRFRLPSEDDKGVEKEYSFVAFLSSNTALRRQNIKPETGKVTCAKWIPIERELLAEVFAYNRKGKNIALGILLTRLGFIP